MWCRRSQGVGGPPSPCPRGNPGSGGAERSGRRFHEDVAGWAAALESPRLCAQFSGVFHPHPPRTLERRAELFVRGTEGHKDAGSAGRCASARRKPREGRSANRAEDDSRSGTTSGTSRSNESVTLPSRAQSGFRALRSESEQAVRVKWTVEGLVGNIATFRLYAFSVDQVSLSKYGTYFWVGMPRIVIFICKPSNLVLGGFTPLTLSPTVSNPPLLQYFNQRLLNNRGYYPLGHPLGSSAVALPRESELQGNEGG